jgi:aerobic-type carbon monoxide dehydrogenase small subunit (CoxS/CutS family)
MKINVNGQDYSVTGEKPLLSVLREKIGMLSVKEGCDDATCGTCVVIANGKLVKSCSRKASTFERQEIITTEGLSSLFEAFSIGPWPTRVVHGVRIIQAHVSQFNRSAELLGQ